MTPEDFARVRTAMKTHGHSFDLVVTPMRQTDGDSVAAANIDTATFFTLTLLEYDANDMIVGGALELDFDQLQAAHGEADIISSALGLDIQYFNYQRS